MPYGSGLVSGVTIKQIAAHLGVSHMTVSRALSGSPLVTAETRALIVKRAEEMGYVASNAARIMRGKANRSVGLSLPNFENAFYARLANRIAERATSLNLQMMIGLTHDDPAREEDVLRQFAAQQVGAVAMVPAPDGGDMPAALRNPVLQLLRQRKGVAAPVLTIEDASAIAAAVEGLKRSGHERIGYIGATATLSTGSSRLAAFRQAMGAAFDAELVRTVAPSAAAGAASMAGLLESPRRPTAVVLGGVELSSGAIGHVLESRQDEAPRLVAYGDAYWYGWVMGGLPAIARPVDELAEAVIAWLLAILDDHPSDPVQAAPPLAARLVRL